MKFFCTLFFALLLNACSVKVDDYRGTTPALDLKQFFNGNMKAYGVLQDHKGTVIRRFTVLMRGKWQGSVGQLHEDFVFDDGEKQTRVWTLRETATGIYEGRADDVIGVADGEIGGMALHWSYTLSVPVDGESYHFAFDDWMWQLDERRMFNKSRMKKWGFTVAEITLFFERCNTVCAE